MSMFYIWSLDRDHRPQNSPTPGVFMVQQIIAQSIYIYLPLICILLSDWSDKERRVLQDSNTPLPSEVAIPVVIGAKIRLNIMLICSDTM